MIVTRYAKKLIVMCHFGDELAFISTCKRNKCACVLFSPRCSRVYSIGYNGPACGLDNESCTGEEGRCGCVHAEANAVAKLYERPRDGVIAYCTTIPCQQCAALLMNTLVLRGIVWSAEYRNEEGRDLLDHANIPMIQRHTLEVIATSEGVVAKKKVDRAITAMKDWYDGPHPATRDLVL